MRFSLATRLLVVGGSCLSLGLAVCYGQKSQRQESTPPAVSAECYRPGPIFSEAEGQKNYERFVDGLDTLKIAKEYPKAVQDLLSGSALRQKAALQVLSASCETEAIPWIVPYLDAPDNDVRVEASSYLEKMVSSTILRERRNQAALGSVVINPLGSHDTDFRPLAWVIYRMLQKPDDGNTRAYAATLVAYIGLPEFEFDLEGLLTSRHPAVSNSAKAALETLRASAKLQGVKTSPVKSLQQ